MAARRVMVWLSTQQEIFTARLRQVAHPEMALFSSWPRTPTGVGPKTCSIVSPAAPTKGTPKESILVCRKQSFAGHDGDAEHNFNPGARRSRDASSRQSVWGEQHGGRQLLRNGV
jgi:hypothetical protein